MMFGFDSDAKILSGVKINDGAVIGANSLVTKEVPAYAIITGKSYQNY